MADRLGVADRLSLPGTIPYEETSGVYREADVSCCERAAHDLAGAIRVRGGGGDGVRLPVLAGHPGRSTSGRVTRSNS